MFNVQIAYQQYFLTVPQMTTSYRYSNDLRRMIIHLSISEVNKMKIGDYHGYALFKHNCIIRFLMDYLTPSKRIKSMKLSKNRLFCLVTFSKQLLNHQVNLLINTFEIAVQHDLLLFLRCK